METKTITAFNRTDFRKWLAKNYEKEKRVAVLLHKRHTGKPAPSHRELMEEAICFGWIDTTIKKIDDAIYVRNFSKRTEKSKWSDNTLRYAKQLIKEGRMTPVGLKFYKLGLQKPTHDADIPKNPSMPIELKKALLKNKKAKIGFDKFPPSTKRMLYRWFLSAKLSETKKKRIKMMLAMGKAGRVDLSNPQE